LFDKTKNTPYPSCSTLLNQGSGFFVILQRVLVNYSIQKENWDEPWTKHGEWQKTSCMNPEPTTKRC